MLDTYPIFILTLLSILISVFLFIVIYTWYNNRIYYSHILNNSSLEIQDDDYTSQRTIK